MSCEDRQVPVRPNRRLVLTGALTLSAAALTGCGVRLEDDAPDIPFIPERDPIPGEAALLAVLGALEASTGPSSQERATSLHQALEQAQVPAKVIAGATAPADAAETVAAFEGAVRDCGPGMLPLVGRLTATQRIVTDAPGTADLWTVSGTTTWKDGSVAADALQATRATTYALDLIAARSSGRVATDVLTASTGLDELSVRQTTAAGEAIEPVRLGYDVAHELSATQAHELGVRSFVRLLAAYADGFARLGEDRAAALEVTQWMVTAQRLSRSQFLQDVPELYGTDPADS